MNINQYLDAAKAVLRCRTDEQLARRLGVWQSRISYYRKGTFLPKVQMARTLAQILNIASVIVVSDLRREKALREQRRRLRSEYGDSHATRRG